GAGAVGAEPPAGGAPRAGRGGGTPPPPPGPPPPPPATAPPPLKLAPYAINCCSSAPVNPSKTLMCGPPPSPAAVTTEPCPLPITSPTATFTPPRKLLAYAS